MPATLDCALFGLGHVGRNLLRLLAERGEAVARDYGLRLRIVTVADSSGLAIRSAGFAPSELLDLKDRGQKVSDIAGFKPGLSSAMAISQGKPDLMFEASPADFTADAAALATIRQALSQGTSAVLANKAPLALDYAGLHDMAARSGAGLAYSATFCGGLPVLNIARRDLVGGRVTALRGVFNATTNYILSRMAMGESYDSALAEAQARGVAETDPRLDVEGWDTAAKLLIAANTAMGLRLQLADIAVTGITAITPADVKKALTQGKQLKLLASCDAQGARVAPVALAADDALARCGDWEMAAELTTDIYGVSFHKLWEREPVPTAAAMLRDAVNLFAPPQPARRMTA